MHDLFSPGFNKQQIKNFYRMCRDLLNEEPEAGDFIIDTKRQVNNHEKQEIWNNARTNELLDPEIFKLDMIGLVCIEKQLLKKFSNDINEIFDCEYEHILSHCHGGRSDSDNVFLLNTHINRHKGSKEIYKFNHYEILGLSYNRGMDSDELLEKLEPNLHNTCKKYNLYFYKMEDGVWSINDEQYNNQYNDKKYHENKKQEAIENIRKYQEKEILIERVYDVFNHYKEPEFLTGTFFGIGLGLFYKIIK